MDDFEFEVPMIPLVGNAKDSTLPTPGEYNFWNALKNRILYLDFEITPDYDLIEMSKVIIQMNMVEKDIPKEELKPIYIFIHSFGGDSFQSTAFCDLLLASRIPIVTVAMGAAMSAGSEILMAGHKRYAFKHAQILIHAGYGSIQGTQSEIEEFQKNNKKNLARTKEYILERTTIDEKTFNKNKNKDWYIIGDELVSYHIVDKLINSIEDIFE